MPFFNRLFGKTDVDPTANLIGELFAVPTPRKIDLARASMTSMACLHEAGHVLMAELHGIPINAVNLPRFDAYSSEQLRPGETLKDATAWVDALDAAEVERHVAFLLGGLLGEINVYDDSALNCPEAIQVFTFGCRGDVQKILTKIRADQARSSYYLELAINLAEAQNASRNCEEREIFLTTFKFQDLREFKDFRNHRSRHRDIAAQLYQRWKQVNFGRWHELGPKFGAYQY